MNYNSRMLPSRETLARAQRFNDDVVDVSGVDLVLSLITTADLIRANIYAQLTKDYGVSEGKFALLMSLYSEGETNASDLALRIGVTPATVSIMVKRMLAASSPLISMSKSGEDGRTRLIALTDAGIKLIHNALPNHLKAIRAFAQVLDSQEQESLIQMLRKLLRK
ncbi:MULTISPECIES: MarR family winged helix-turn-helix transcriptional regulator [unclassified Gilliamella]|uniref:MarR family winged helix-turn-helix transcriptional regulator n=1 Tax=unclassified Gilliamella TaxID=2685620 RepID=UPI002269C4DD|nr:MULTISPECIES: MarR family winged helix-turn-helix transcriptional regulator [unclassified Gilliamella]MCX8640950.1 winged helix-turn-helix transcriptional regulator [Gilliamella sp. B3835]MCX8707889.1 winged helix-turn-helix transcriptional regulator [Gilliamella sp. B3783]MCX8710274.1 winged helix-turn-helix transcriptional regulator [Gilliamella sp. B3780]MCX8712492.1 winged helix-turn-helix transcriptional regulator [Gilliamella sp. B3468]MCX8714869.1 winged helix-turn-helix transcriptio